MLHLSTKKQNIKQNSGKKLFYTNTERLVIKMNKYAILHIPDSRYCFATGAKELVLRLRMSREDDGTKVSLIYAQKYDFTLERHRQVMEVCY